MKSESKSTLTHKLVMISYNMITYGSQTKFGSIPFLLD